MKREILASIIVLIGFISPLLVEASTPKHNHRAKQVLKLLTRVAEDGKPMFGHQDALLYGHSFRYLKTSEAFNQSDIYDVCGDYPAVLGLDLGRTEVSDINLDYQRLDNIIGAAKAHFDRGGIITISWHADNPLTGKDAWDVADGFTVSKILYNKEANSIFMERLKRLGDILCQIQDSQGHLIPILFRPYHENNLEFWWGGSKTRDEDFKKLWILTYNYLVKKRKLTNLIWVYSPYTIKNEETFCKRYPGNKFVDVISYEQYHHKGNPNQGYINSIREGLAFTTQFAKSHGKIAVLGECGLSGVDIDWWTNVLSPAIQDYNIAYLLVWRNGFQASDNNAPYPGSVSESNFVEFYNQHKTLFLKDINKKKK